MQNNPWRRIAITVSVMLAVLLLAASWRYLQSRGVFTSVEETAPGVCRQVPGIGAVKDIAPGRMGGAYIASTDGLYIYRGSKTERMAGTPKDFHPVALAAFDNTLHVLFRQHDHWTISVFSAKSMDTTVLYDAGVRPRVATKDPTLETIAVSKPVPPKVEELGRLTTDVLTDPADIALLDSGRFYLINRHASRTGLGRWLDDAFLLPRANVLYFDGVKFVTVAERLNSPAGLALSADGSRLYVSEDYPRTLASFSRNDLMGSLDNPAVLSLPANPLKISLGANGALIVTARPKAGAGQVWRVTLENGVPQKTELIYSHKGEGVNTAALLGTHLLIGTESKLLDCVP
jgi:hypothetical protein